MMEKDRANLEIRKNKTQALNNATNVSSTINAATTNTSMDANSATWHEKSIERGRELDCLWFTEQIISFFLWLCVTIKKIIAITHEVKIIEFVVKILSLGHKSPIVGQSSASCSSQHTRYLGIWDCSSTMYTTPTWVKTSVIMAGGH